VKTTRQALIDSGLFAEKGSLRLVANVVSQSDATRETFVVTIDFNPFDKIESVRMHPQAGTFEVVGPAVDEPCANAVHEERRRIMGIIRTALESV
jgi:hypothetical protein